MITQARIVLSRRLPIGCPLPCYAGQLPCTRWRNPGIACRCVRWRGEIIEPIRLQDFQSLSLEQPCQRVGLTAAVQLISCDDMGIYIQSLLLFLGAATPAHTS